MQERITTTKKGSITSVQAVYVPADDLTDPAPATTFAHLDATTVLSRSIAELGIYPAVDPLDSKSRILDPRVVGAEHYEIATGVQKILQNYKSLQDIIAILGMDELSEEDKLVGNSCKQAKSESSKCAWRTRLLICRHLSFFPRPSSVPVRSSVSCRNPSPLPKFSLVTKARLVSR